MDSNEPEITRVEEQSNDTSKFSVIPVCFEWAGDLATGHPLSPSHTTEECLLRGKTLFFKGSSALLPTIPFINIVSFQRITRANRIHRRKTAHVVLPAHETGEDDSDVEHQVHSEDEDGDLLEDFPDDTEELDLIHSRLNSLAGLRLERFKHSLKKLCLRQNHISSLDPQTFQQLTLLTELDLYDNKLKNNGIGSALDNLSELRILDFSFNIIKHVPECLEKLPSLDTIYFVQNKIHRINHLGACANLRSLELGGNRIRTIEHLDALVNLEELWLGKNKITKLENLSGLKKLRILSIQSNRITKLEGLDELLSLEEIYLSHNGIEKIEGLDNNLHLKTVDIGFNFVAVLENVSHLTNLEELWMSGNKIPDLKALEKELGHLEKLETLYLEGNPCETDDRTGYRRKVILALPQLKQLDATYVRAA